MSKLFLVEPTADLEKPYLSFYNDWRESGETMIPRVIQQDPQDFQQMLKVLADNKKGVNIPIGRVPASTYCLINGESMVIGAVNIRHRLTEFLFNAGGHIGYGIRPSQRNKGYATEILKLSLQKSKELGIKKALVVCDKDNIASRKVILKNGGVEDSEFVEENGNVVSRFWFVL